MLRPSPDDGEIERALIELDEKLTAWMAAVCQVQAAIMEPAGPALPSVEEHPPSAPQEPPPLAASGTESDEDEPWGAPVEPTAASESVCEQRRRDPSCNGGGAVLQGSVPPLFDGRGSETASPIASETALDAAEAAPAVSEAPLSAPEAAAEPTPASREDEQALLASLAPEVANAVRMMRRLNPGKSWRELIEEYEGIKKPTTPALADKKPWWRRLR